MPPTFRIIAVMPDTGEEMPLDLPADEYALSKTAQLFQVPRSALNVVGNQLLVDGKPITPQQGHLIMEVLRHGGEMMIAAGALKSEAAFDEFQLQEHLSRGQKPGKA